MAKKRKSDATSLDEADRTTYATFCSAANSLSQLYSQAMSQQKLTFRSGERHSLEKLYQWILWQQEQGSRVAGADILAYLQQELDCGEEDSSMSPRQLQNQQHSQPANSVTSNLQNLPVGQGPVGSGPRSAQAEQSRNLVFSNALSSPVRQNLQPFQLTQGGYYQNTLIAHNGTILNRDSNSVSLNDTAMDMHSDSPPHEPHQ